MKTLCENEKEDELLETPGLGSQAVPTHAAAAASLPHPVGSPAISSRYGPSIWLLARTALLPLGAWLRLQGQGLLVWLPREGLTEKDKHSCLCLCLQKLPHSIKKSSFYSLLHTLFKSKLSWSMNDSCSPTCRTNPRSRAMADSLRGAPAADSCCGSTRGHLAV